MCFRTVVGPAAILEMLNEKGGEYQDIVNAADDNAKDGMAQGECCTPFKVAIVLELIQKCITAAENVKQHIAKSKRLVESIEAIRPILHKIKNQELQAAHGQALEKLDEVLKNALELLEKLLSRLDSLEAAMAVTSEQQAQLGKQQQRLEAAAVESIRAASGGR